MTVTIDNERLNYKLYAYILNVIDPNYYGDNAETPKEKLQFVMQCFLNEYVHEYNKRRYKNNFVLLFSEWLAGLPGCIDVEYRSYQILEIGRELELINGHFARHKKPKKHNYYEN